MPDPIRPEDIVSNKLGMLPDVVIDTFNRLITEGFSAGRSIVKQNAVVAALEDCGLDRRTIFDRHYLDVEHIYRASGWNVEYEKPGYNESGEAFFTFTPKEYQDAVAEVKKTLAALDAKETPNAE